MKELVEQLIKEGYLKTQRIIEAFLRVDRKDFVTEEEVAHAHENIALPTKYGQTISQPVAMAFMLELLQPHRGQRIMDVGAGSCWQTALLAHIVGMDGKVFAVERLGPLLRWGKMNFEKYGFTNAEFFCRDGTKGLPERAPFDAIIAAAAGERMIKTWEAQTNIGGRIVAPIGHSVWLYVKKSEIEFEKQEHYGFEFVPLIEGEERD